MGFPDTCVPLPPDATDDELAELCRDWTARLKEHIAAEQQRLSNGDDERLTKTRYDGTMKSACQIYQEHPLSSFHEVSHKTRRGYLADLKVIIGSVGARRIKNVTVLDVKNWYRQWRKGVEYIDDDGERWFGPERVARAHNAVAMVRTVLRFTAALRHADCKLLADELAKIQFEREGARDQELSYRHAVDFLRGASEMSAKGLIAPDRALAMSIGVAAQFELMLRQGDIIGKWEPRRADAKFPAGVSVLHLEQETWSGFFTWEKIPGWRWRTRTSKSKYRAAVEFDLANYDLLFPLLEQVPMDQRTGAIVKGEHGLPIRYRTYAKTFRKIARYAKIPDEVWSMDARAGGATEAEEAGVDIQVIQQGMTHTNTQTTARYIRKRTKKIATIAEARKQARAGGDDGGTA
ncbi:tyrosine-type recombinase/integrase [Rhodopseudomonas sp. BR0G17]|uniref:tyrosine-type recombinase/integrase n=1 Tax=Rhodopseudomonas sp. BR0G17 TaxID=2269368 RepID=UPI0013E0AE73|nr:tyrosine-type recombinase/integrase [Rhodopseudomonas sp. BR0G17]NEW95528.1 site-specific integrase [Rhodopseudomonas sp. BR0G17]